MERQQFKRLGLNMGFCSKFYLEIKHLIGLSISQAGILNNSHKNVIFQILTSTYYNLFHVKQTFPLMNEYTSPNSFSYLLNVNHEIIFNGNRSYTQFPTPFICLKDDVAKLQTLPCR